MNKISFYFSSEFNSSRSQIYLLIDKILQNGNKIFLYCDQESAALIDKEIWTFSQQKFIPHLLYNEISDDFEIDNTNLIIFEKYIFPKENTKPNFLIIANPSEEYINFVNQFAEKQQNLSILVFFFNEYKNENLDNIALKYERKIFSINEDKAWKEIKTRN